MSGTKQIATLHASVTANAAQFIAEFDRADKASKAHGASIRDQVSHTVDHLEKHFSSARFAHGWLTAMGVGSGAMAVEHLFEKYKEIFDEPKEDAKEFAKYMGEALKAGRDLSELRLANFVAENSPGKGAETIEQRLEIMRRQQEAAEERRAEAIRDLGIVGADGFQAGSAEGGQLKDKYGLGMFGSRKNLGDAAQGAEQSAFEDAERLQKAIEHWEKVLKEIHDKKLPDAIDKALTDFFKPLDEAAAKLHEKLDQGADRLKEKLRTPLEKLSDSIADAFNLFDTGRIDDTTLGRAVAAANRLFDKETTPDLSRFEKASAIKVDEMTKRGLGSGADYRSVQDSQSRVLVEIRDMIKTAIARGVIQPRLAN